MLSHFDMDTNDAGSILWIIVARPKTTFNLIARFKKKVNKMDRARRVDKLMSDLNRLHLPHLYRKQLELSGMYTISPTV